MAMASLLAPYDSYSIRQTVTIEGDTDRDVQPGFFKRDDNTIYWMNCYPTCSAVGFVITYRLDNDLSVV